MRKPSGNCWMLLPESQTPRFLQLSCVAEGAGSIEPRRACEVSIVVFKICGVRMGAPKAAAKTKASKPAAKRAAKAKAKAKNKGKPVKTER